MRIRAAYQSHVEHAREGEIVDVMAFPLHEARILFALHGDAEGMSGWSFGTHWLVHGPAKAGHDVLLRLSRGRMCFMLDFWTVLFRVFVVSCPQHSTVDLNKNYDPTAAGSRNFSAACCTAFTMFW